MPRAATWARTSRPVGVHRLEGGQHPAVVVTAARAGGQRDRQRAAARGGHGPQRLGLLVELGEVGHDLQHAGAQPAEGGGDADQLVALGGERRRVLASAGAVVAGPRRGEARAPPAATPSAASAAHRRRSRPRWGGRCGRRPAHPWRGGAARRAAPGRRGRCRAGRRSSASRYSPNVCHDQSRPSWRAEPGMSSTPSISSIRRSWSAGWTGAKPTPQLPMTTVVTPCQADGSSRLSQVAWPS